MNELHEIKVTFDVRTVLKRVERDNHMRRMSLVKSKNKISV